MELATLTLSYLRNASGRGTLFGISTLSYLRNFSGRGTLLGISTCIHQALELMTCTELHDPISFRPSVSTKYFDQSHPTDIYPIVTP